MSKAGGGLTVQLLSAGKGSQATKGIVLVVLPGKELGVGAPQKYTTDSSHAIV